MASFKPYPKIDYRNIRQVALVNINAILARFAGGGKVTGNEYYVRNPKRSDQNPSLMINIRTGAWGDFAVNKTGGDLISLVAYIEDMTQWEAAKGIADMCGVSAYE